MIICGYCAHQNKEGTLFCMECGRRFAGGDSGSVISTQQLKAIGEDVPFHSSWGTARFSTTSQIVIHIRDFSDVITVTPERCTVLGRNDIVSTQRPDLDLTPFGALEKGVSRVHAAIYRNEDTDTLTLVDMGSSNGTHLNGQRLAPDQPRVLRDGDEIRLGKLVAHIYFKD